MAETKGESDQLLQSKTAKDVQEQEEKLKYLGLVQVMAIQTLICFSRLYDFAKDNSGPLKPGVQSVEGAVKAVVGPIYEKVHGFPYELLKFVDRKVDYSLTKLDRHTPALVRQAYTVAHEAPALAWSVADEVYRAGVVGTATGLAKTTVAKLLPTAKVLYGRYEPVAEHYAVSAWRSLNKLPLFPQVAQILVPTAAYWSEKYNVVVCYGRGKGYLMAAYLPPVPTERIAKVFGPPVANNGPAPEEAAVVVE